jgi:hypothetical protein
VKKPDTLVLIIVWQFLSAFLALSFLLAIAVIALPDASAAMWGAALPGAIFGLSIIILMLISYIIIAVTAAVGIIRNQEWGRVLGIVHSALTLIAIPLGTIIGILIIIYLTQQNVIEYFRISTK